MRTHKKHGVFLAGIDGFKIYFVNLKYQPVSEHETITKNFLNFVGAV